MQMKSSANELAEKVGQKHYWISAQFKTDPGSAPQNNYKRNGQVNKDKPGRREFPYLRAPIAKGQVKN